MNFIAFPENGPDTVLIQAKRELEKERELLMSRSLPGLEDNQTIENDSDSESDTESDDKSMFFHLCLLCCLN